MKNFSDTTPEGPWGQGFFLYLPFGNFSGLRNSRKIGKSGNTPKPFTQTAALRGAPRARRLQAELHVAALLAVAELRHEPLRAPHLLHRGAELVAHLRVLVEPGRGAMGAVLKTRTWARKRAARTEAPEVVSPADGREPPGFVPVEACASEKRSANKITENSKLHRDL